jgi:predicted PurR-regulated permease PerM
MAEDEQQGPVRTDPPSFPPRPGLLTRVRTALGSSEGRRGVREALARRRELGRSHAGFQTLDEMLAERAAARADTATAAGGTVTTAPPPVAAALGQDPGAKAPTDQAPAHDAAAAPAPQGRFGRPGRDFDRAHPFYVGFVGAIGVLMAIGLVQALDRVSGTITLLVVALFLALGLEPVVEWLVRHGVRRGGAIALVFLAVVAVFVGFGFMVVPIIVDQGTELVTRLPTYVEDVQRAQWFVDLDNRYDIVGRVTQELQQRLANGETFAAVFGGVLGAGQALLGGVFSTLTVLILTLYFLASMRTLRSTAYRLVPASRRRRVQLLGDEISKRIGGYVMGQIAIATLNGVCSYVMMLLLGIPYPAVLAIVVGLFGLIPLVGATIGAVLVVAVALFVSLPTAIIVLVYYVVYQQLENYVIAPKVMARTVSVPGGVAIVAALVGAGLLGALGALIAIPLAAGILLVVQEVAMPRQDRL